jgi:hypothetical protein
LTDPITQEEVNIQLSWPAQNWQSGGIPLIWPAAPTDYLLQALAAVIAGNEEDTILTDDGGFLCSRDGYGEDGMTPQND